MTPALVAATAVALAVASAVLAIRPPTRRLGPAIAPYAQRARMMMGQPLDPAALDAPDLTADRPGVLRSMLGDGARRLSGMVDAGGEDGVMRRLRQAGWRAMTYDEYRAHQVASAGRGAVLFLAVALAIAPSAGGALAGAALGGLWGTARWRARVDRAIAERRSGMRAELYTVAQLLAIAMRAGTAPIVAVRELTERGGGAVCDELGDALDAIDHGTTPRLALERTAADTPEPAAGRLYRLLATTETGTGDTLADALLKLAGDVRGQRREDLERLATRRRFQMLVPTVALMGPVMLLLLAAPIPTFIFGD